MITMIRSVEDLWMLVAIAAVITPLSAQSYRPIYTPTSQNTWYYQCQDPYYNPVPYASFTATPGVYEGTNSHLHGINAFDVFSTVSPTQGVADWDGWFGITVTTTKVGQAEFLYLTCSAGGGEATYTANYAVGYSDLYYNDHPDIWLKIGATAGHGSTDYNRYMQLYPDLNSGPAYGLYYSTQTYLSLHPGVTQICTNDMALPFGGKFDVDLNWTNPHISHDRGTAVDVAGPSSNGCPAANQVIISDFLNACVANGAFPANSIPEGNHAHCNFADPASYPH
jgi:hypothetical protein